MSTTLEHSLEQVGMQLCKRQPELANVVMVHYDNKERRAVNRVVFRATQKEQQANGPRAFKCVLQIEFVTGAQMSPNQADSIMAGIDKAFGRESLNDPDGLDSLTKFSVLTPYEEGGDGAKENENQHRVRIRTVPFIAKLII